MIFYVNLAQVSRILATVWEQSHPTFVDIELLQFPLVLPPIQRKAKRIYYILFLTKRLSMEKWESTRKSRCVQSSDCDNNNVIILYSIKHGSKLI